MRLHELIKKMSKLRYEVQIAKNCKAIWVHCSDGSTVGRFGTMGIDIHTSLIEQLNGAPQCRLCIHGESTLKDLRLFIEKAKEYWHVTINETDYSFAKIS